MPRKVVDMTGAVVNHLTVIRRAGTKNRYAAWLCRCTCGKLLVISRSALSCGQKSCGCMSKAISHHKSTSAEYTSWRAMRERCYNKKSKAYSRYGGRGVVVCEEWKHSFETFFNDMGKKPSKKHSLDRIDPNKEYSKENCRWVLPTTQSFNQRIRKDNSSGYPGIRYDTKLKKWVSTIGASGSQGHYLGVFSSFEEAVEKRLEAELMQYGEYKLKSGQ